jgi:hypothetical protein
LIAGYVGRLKQRLGPEDVVQRDVIVDVTETAQDLERGREMAAARNRIGIGALWIAGTLSCGPQDGSRGHWSGSVTLPDQSLAMEVDLDKGPNGWIGSSSIPAQNASAIPLDAIAFTNGKCTFRITGAPGRPDVHRHPLRRWQNHDR